jgi:8-oxo-dGTP pyrophosphatase MutT (NUDIX family)
MNDADWTPGEREASFGVIVFRSGAPLREVLLVKTDHWGFPKGHAEDGEDGQSAALREVLEETGITAKVADGAKTLTEAYEILRKGITTKKTVTYWVGEGSGDPHPKEGEIAETGWFVLEDALELLTYGGTRNLLRSLL